MKKVELISRTRGRITYQTSARAWDRVWARVKGRVWTRTWTRVGFRVQAHVNKQLKVAG